MLAAKKKNEHTTVNIKYICMFCVRNESDNGNTLTRRLHLFLSHNIKVKCVYLCTAFGYFDGRCESTVV